MTLLWITIACLAGLWVGGWILDVARGQGLLALACGIPGWVWLLPALLLPLTPLLNRWARPVPGFVMRWPESAGFRAPRQSPAPALMAACLLAAAMGMLRGLGSPAEPCWGPGDLASLNVPAERAFDRSLPAMAVHGFITGYVPDATGRLRLSIEATAVESGKHMQALQGGFTTLMEGSRAAAAGLQYGSPVRVWGVPSTPPEFNDFSYREYLARQGIHSQMATGIVSPEEGPLQGNPLLRALYGVRKAGERLLNRALPEPYAALANGMLLGIDANIPDATMQAFSDTSSSHVLVISGSNVALLSGVIYALTRRMVRPKVAAGVTLGAIGLYALIVGGEPSVVRAAVMGGLVVTAIAIGRRSTALVSLAAAVLAMVLLNPNILHDVGFQLSATATAGLVLLTPLLSGGRELEGDRVVGEGILSPLSPVWASLREVLVVTLAASIAVQPLLLYHFQRVSLVGLLTNLLIVPVQPMILMLGSGGLLLGMLGGLAEASVVAFPLLWAAWLGLAWSVRVVEMTAEWRWASLAIGGYGALAMIATYAALGLLLWQHQRTQRPSGRPEGGRFVRALASPVGMGTLLLVCALLWVGVAGLPDGRLTIHSFEADRGNGVVVTLPSGGQLLIDGGGDPARILTALGGLLPLWDRRVELVVLSIDDKATAEAQAELPRRLRVQAAVSSAGKGEARDLWARSLADAGTALLALEPGGWLDLGDGVTLWALPAEAGQPAALKLVYGATQMLIPGSAKAPPAANVAANPALYAAGVLLAPDIRDGESLATGWMEAARPGLVLSWEDAMLLPPAGLAPTIHVPATHGALTLTSDGSGWRMESAP